MAWLNWSRMSGALILPVRPVPQFFSPCMTSPHMLAWFFLQREGLRFQEGIFQNTNPNVQVIIKPLLSHFLVSYWPK